MSDTTAFRIHTADSAPAFGLAALFSGVDGLARAAGAVALGSFLFGMIVVLIAAAWHPAGAGLASRPCPCLIACAGRTTG